MTGVQTCALPISKNWRSNSWGKGKELYERFKKNNLVGAGVCSPGCVMRCKRRAKVDSGKWKTPIHEGAEYETMSVFTFYLLNEDVDAAVHAGYLCNEYGLDTISVGSVIAFAMDCYAESIISKKETDGLDLSWGNADTIVTLVKKIANSEGIGKILGEGVRKASQYIGKGSEKFAVHVKGLEGPAHDARCAKTQAIMYSMANRGMCHIHPLEGWVYDVFKLTFGLIPYGLHDPKDVDPLSNQGKAKVAKLFQDYGIVPDILGICKFFIYPGLGPGDLAKLVSTLTGWDIDGGDIMRDREPI